MSRPKCGDEFGIEGVIKNIENAFDSLSGDEIAEIHNNTCDSVIEYNGDGIWEVVGTEY